MAKVVIALGSNLGDRLRYMSEALAFCNEISTPGKRVMASSLYESDPVGIANQPFLNAVLSFHTELPPEDLLCRLKSHETEAGRNPDAPRWSNRPVDLDIIGYDAIILQKKNLVIPHASYPERLFVLLPLQEIEPEWVDPLSGLAIDTLIQNAPNLRVYKTSLKW
ncbi:MAG: 2-amino-4-hydroxy-6-hydroxymethyldihydropteridine diphosphokinase [Balneolia bacterium]|nr:2-amino-4-hydroxy-6-hydroxymethyldihydropteridine diphosphokinase [Balneolia bacterium]